MRLTNQSTRRKGLTALRRHKNFAALARVISTLAVAIKEWCMKPLFLSPFILLLPSLLFSTPANGTHTYKTFLGLIDSNYICLEFLSHNPGNHYERIDSIQIAQYSIHNNRTTSKTLLKVTQYITDPNSGRIDTTEIFRHNRQWFDLEKYTPIRSASILTSNYEVIIDKNGIQLFDGKEKIINLIDQIELLRAISFESMTQIRLKDIYLNKESLFLHVQYLDSNAMHQETIIPIKNNNNIW